MHPFIRKGFNPSGINRQAGPISARFNTASSVYNLDSRCFSVTVERSPADVTFSASLIFNDIYRSELRKK